MFAVHTDQLRRVGTDLDAISTGLSRNAKATLADDLRGNGPVTRAISSVEHDWSRQRTQICAYLAALGAGARSAAELYAAVDRELANQLTLGSR